MLFFVRRQRVDQRRSLATTVHFTKSVHCLSFLRQSSTSARKATGDDSARSKGLRAMVENLGDLWDQNQYDEEYNIDNFIRSLTDK